MNKHHVTPVSFYTLKFYAASSGVTVTKQFFGLGERIESSNYYFTQDHLGSVREMVDGSGAVTARYDSGFYMNRSSGLDLTWYRGYDANKGRWLSRDPIEDKKIYNLYYYAVDDPIRYTDPDGRQVAGGAAIGTDICPGLGTLLGAAAGLLLAVGASDIIDAWCKRHPTPCPTKSNCPPCVPPAGTIGWKFHVTHGHGPYDAHVHLFIRSQDANCGCHWNEIGTSAPPPPPPPAVPLGED